MAIGAQQAAAFESTTPGKTTISTAFAAPFSFQILRPFVMASGLLHRHFALLYLFKPLLHALSPPITCINTESVFI